jgi:hypothetical protein
MRSPILFLLILLAPLARLAAQQESLPARWLKPDSGTVARLQDRVQGRTRVRIFVNAAAVEVARPTLDDTGLQPQQPDEWPSVPWGNVSRVQVRTSALLHGVKLGGIIGGSLGLLVGLSATRPCEGWDFFCGAEAGEVAAFTALSALSGAFWGGLIAAPFGRWSTVYRALPRPAAPPVALVPTREGGVALVGSVRF